MSAVQLQTHWKDDTLPAKVIKYLGPDWGLSKHTFRQAVRHFVVLSDKVGIRDQAYSNWLLAQQQAAEPTPPTLPTPQKSSQFSSRAPRTIPYNNPSFTSYWDQAQTDSPDKEARASPASQSPGDSTEQNTQDPDHPLDISSLSIDNQLSPSVFPPAPTHSPLPVNIIMASQQHGLNSMDSSSAAGNDHTAGNSHAAPFSEAQIQMAAMISSQMNSAIRTAVEQLQPQLAPMPGPQGPPGPEGQPGQPGDVGDSSQSLKVEDIGYFDPDAKCSGPIVSAGRHACYRDVMRPKASSLSER